MARTLDQILSAEKPEVVANAQAKANTIMAELREQQESALQTAVEAGEQSRESDLSLHDIAARVKQQHNV